MMDKRYIGIDIGPAHIRAAQILGTPDGFRVEKVFCTATRRASDSPTEIMRSLFETHGFDRGAEVAVSMPHDALFFRNIQTDAAGLDQLRRADASALENSFPIAPDNVVAQVCSSNKCGDDKFSVLTVAVSKTSLDEKQEILNSAHIHPRLFDAPVFAFLQALAVNNPRIRAGRSVVVYFDDACLTLAVTADNDVLMVRNIPITLPSKGEADSARMLAQTIASEIPITWHKAFGQAIDGDAEIFLLTDPGDYDSLKPLLESVLNCRVTIPNPLPNAESSSDERTGFSYYVAEGLALRILAPEKTKGVNFLDAAKAAVPTIDVKKEIVTYSVLAASLIVLLVLGLFAQLWRLEGAYADVKGRIRETFTAVLPQEKNIVSPLAQMEQKLASFRKDHQLGDSFSVTGMSPLQVLRAISLVAPSQAKLEIDNLLIADGSVRIVGTCGSFESVYQWQRLLEQVDGFEQVDVKDVQRRTDSGLAQFTIVISSRIQESK
jgi:hypothetical protein